MKSLLEKLGKEKSKNETRQENEIQNQQIGRETEKTNAGDHSGPGSIQPAMPCPACGAVIAWWDRYGGGPHCHRCRDWPSVAVVARIVAADNGRWLKLWPLGEWGAVQQAPDASCPHSRSRKRVVWPVAERGNLLVADLERWQEAEVFEECLRCGEWI